MFVLESDVTAFDSNTESDLGWEGKSSPHPAPSSAGNAILHVPRAPGPPSEKAASIQTDARCVQAGGPQDVRWVRNFTSGGFRGFAHGDTDATRSSNFLFGKKEIKGERR